MKILIIRPTIPKKTEKGQRPSEKAKNYVRIDTDVDDTHIDYGPASVESLYDDTMAAPFIVKKAEWAEKNGYDAVVVGCMMDPGVNAAREAVNIPVVGPKEVCMNIASMVGNNPKIILPEGIPVLKMREDPEETYQALKRAAEKAVNEGADVVILGCTALSGMAARLNKELGIPVLENLGTAVKIAEMLVDLGVTHSKKAYPKPPEKKRILPG